MTLFRRASLLLPTASVALGSRPLNVNLMDVSVAAGAGCSLAVEVSCSGSALGVAESAFGTTVSGVGCVTVSDALPAVDALSLVISASKSVSFAYSRVAA